MTEKYPISMHCRFEGFPARARFTCGPAFDALSGCPYSYGSRVDCAQTPASRTLQGDLLQGECLPVYEMIYSDTGEDENFGLKVASYGYGTFYAAGWADPFYSLAVVKGIRLEAAGFARAFETLDLWETKIPVETAMWNIEETPAVVWIEGAAQGRFAAVWYAGEAPGGLAAVKGILQLGGPAYVRVFGDAS